MLNSSNDASCFNAFSHVDVRVEVKIPGTVEAYIVDVRGEKYVFWISKLGLCVLLEY